MAGQFYTRFEPTQNSLCILLPLASCPSDSGPLARACWNNGSARHVGRTPATEEQPVRTCPSLQTKWWRKVTLALQTVLSGIGKILVIHFYKIIMQLNDVVRRHHMSSFTHYFLLLVIQKEEKEEELLLHNYYHHCSWASIYLREITGVIIQLLVISDR